MLWVQGRGLRGLGIRVDALLPPACCAAEHTAQKCQHGARGGAVDGEDPKQLGS